MDTKEPLLRSDCTIYRGGVISMENTRNVKVTDCQFTDVGGNAIMLSGYNKTTPSVATILVEPAPAELPL